MRSQVRTLPSPNRLTPLSCESGNPGRQRTAADPLDPRFRGNDDTSLRSIDTFWISLLVFAEIRRFRWPQVFRPCQLAHRRWSACGLGRRLDAGQPRCHYATPVGRRRGVGQADHAGLFEPLDHAVLRLQHLREGLQAGDQPLRHARLGARQRHQLNADHAVLERDLANGVDKRLGYRVHYSIPPRKGAGRALARPEGAVSDQPTPTTWPSWLMPVPSIPIEKDAVLRSPSPSVALATKSSF